MDAADRLERRVQLGRRLALVLDRCLLTRPEIVAALRDEATPGRAEAADASLVALLWVRPDAQPAQAAVARSMEHLAWQARLLGPLLRETGVGPAGPAYRRLGERLRKERGETVHPAAPERACVWVVGAIAPAQLDGLEMLDAAGCAVTLLVHSASTEFLGDLLPAAWFDDETAAELDDPDLHRERPHPLLAAWGQLTRDRQALLLEREENNEAWARRDAGDAVEPADRGLLATLQATVRGARPPGAEARAEPDGSVVVHGCAGERRQVEVLRERLLVAFDELDGLTPEDVVVLCPDLEAFAPHVEAVFARPVPPARADAEGSDRRLVANLSGRSPRRERPAVSAFFRLLGVLRGRAEAPEVAGLLADPAFAAGVDAEEAAALAEDVAAAGVSFGFDAGHRASLGRPADATHTWEAGLDRLTLGSLLPPPASLPGAEAVGVLPAPVGAVTPLDRASRAEAAGGLAGFVARLREAFDEAAEPADARGWAERAARWTGGFLAEGFDDAGARQAREAAAALADDAEAAGLGDPLPLGGVGRGAGPAAGRGGRRRPLPDRRRHRVRAPRLRGGCRSAWSRGWA